MSTATMALGSVVLFAGYLTWSRAHVWNSVTLLWQDSALHSPNKSRVRFGLGNAYLHSHRCSEAVQEYEAAARLQQPDYTLYYNWAAAYDCVHRPDQAAELLIKGITDRPTASGYAMLAYIQGELRIWKDSLESLQRAEQLDPGYALTYAYRGLVYAAIGRKEQAYSQFTRCLEIDPANPIARKERASLYELGFR